jgi:hypothetical protein
VLLVASPYAKHESASGQYSGYIGHHRYDQASVIRTVELILGLPTLSSYDQNARPLYDLFQDKSSADELTPSDLAGFVPVPEPAFLNERVADLPPTAALQALKQQSDAMPKGQDKQGPQLEVVDWKATTARPVPAALQKELQQAPARSGDD